MHCHLNAYSIAKFDQNSIILYQRETKKFYEYLEGVRLSGQGLQDCESLERGIAIDGGCLYPQSISNIDHEIIKRMKRQYKEYFTQTEIINTFTPVIEALLSYREKQYVHGSIARKNIVINQEGEVKLRDCYLHNDTKAGSLDEDFRDLAGIIIQAATLQAYETNKISFSCLHNILPKFDKSFILAIFIMTNMRSSYYSFVINLLEKGNRYIDEEQKLSLLFKQAKICLNTQPKVVFTTPLIKHIRNIDSPKKIAPAKKATKGQDLENKRILEETKKRTTLQKWKKPQKHLQKSTKKVTDPFKRSNAFKNLQQIHEIDNLSYLRREKEEERSLPGKRVSTLSRKKH